MGHAIERLSERISKAAKNSPDLISNPKQIIQEIKTNWDTAQKVYNVPNVSFAIQIYPTFDFFLGQERAYDMASAMDYRAEQSNGNMLVLIIRDRRAVTCMFRRSDNLGKISQPFTPKALDVDEVITYEEFIRDSQSFIASAWRKI